MTDNQKSAVWIPVTDSQLEDLEAMQAAMHEEPPVLPTVTRDEAEAEVLERHSQLTTSEGMSLHEALQIVQLMQGANIQVEIDNRLAMSQPAEPVDGNSALDHLSRSIGRMWHGRAERMPYPFPHVGSTDGLHFWAAYDDEDGIPQTFDSQAEWEQWDQKK